MLLFIMLHDTYEKNILNRITYIMYAYTLFRVNRKLTFFEMLLRVVRKMSENVPKYYVQNLESLAQNLNKTHSP